MFVSDLYSKLILAPSEVQPSSAAKEPSQPKVDKNTAKTCSCDNIKKPPSNKNSEKESEEEDKINFENALHNVVYIKKT